MKSIMYLTDLSARFMESKRITYHARYLKEQSNTLKRIFAGRPYILNSYYIPGEICRLFDVEVIYNERLAGFAAASGILSMQCSGQTVPGIPACACTYQQAFDILIKEKLIPMPDSLVAMNYTCDDVWMYYRLISERNKIPLNFIDTGTDVYYLGMEFEKLYEWLKNRYVQVRPIGDVVHISNKTMELKRKIDALRLAYPGILDSTDSFKLFTLYNDLGTEHAYEILYELKQKLMEKACEFSLPTRRRILWLGLVPLYDIGLIEKIEKEYRCKIVFEELFDFTDTYLCASSFFNDLASRIYSSLYFSTENRLRVVLKYTDILKVSGIIHFSQRNCVFLPSMLPLMRKELSETQIPLVELSGDVINPAFFDRERLRGMLDTFFEIIDGGA